MYTIPQNLVRGLAPSLCKPLIHSRFTHHVNDSHGHVVRNGLLIRNFHYIFADDRKVTPLPQPASLWFTVCVAYYIRHASAYTCSLAVWGATYLHQVLEDLQTSSSPAHSRQSTTPVGGLLIKIQIQILKLFYVRNENSLSEWVQGQFVLARGPLCGTEIMVAALAPDTVMQETNMARMIFKKQALRRQWFAGVRGGGEPRAAP
jgi:hypothetical protein